MGRSLAAHLGFLILKLHELGVRRRHFARSRRLAGDPNQCSRKFSFELGILG